MTNPTVSPGAPQPSSLRFKVDGMSCEHCRQQVERAALAVAGVTAAQVDLAAATLTVTGGAPAAVRRAVEEAGYTAVLLEQSAGSAPLLPVPAREPEAGIGLTDNEAESFLLRIEGMHCASCVRRIEETIAGVKGVHLVSVNLLESSARVVGGDPDKVAAAVVAAGYEATVPHQVRPSGGTDYEIDILGMHCASCVHKVEQALLAVPGVLRATVDLVGKNARVRGGIPEQVVKAIVTQGYGAALRPLAAPADTFFVKLQPHPSAEDLEMIHDILQARDVDTEVVFAEGRLRLSTGQHPADVLLRLTDIGFQAELEEMYADPAIRQAQETRQEIRLSWRRAILAGLAGFGIMAGDMSGLFPRLPEGQVFWALTALFCLLVMYYCGRNYFIGAWKQLMHRSANMDTLVALGTGAAWLSSVIVIADPVFLPDGGNHIYLDASVMILAFLQLGRALETRAKRTTSEAIGALVGLRVRTARVSRAAGEVEVPVSLLRIGDKIRVRPGQKVPIDGVITSGSTTIDESMLTGEPVAVQRRPGDAVTGGTMNRSGAFVLRVTRLGDDTTLARIIRLVKEAQMSKPAIGRLVDRIASVFVPVVILISITAFFSWMTMGPEPRLAYALTTAIAVLVIACPCALGLATPIAIMVGTSRAAQSNVLIRNSDALQTASTLTHVVVDKTGTLTEGRPAVTAVFPVAGCTENEVLQWAASLESGSEHPLADAVLRAQRQTGDPLFDLDTFTAVPGRGVRGERGGVAFFLGNDHFLAEQGLSLPEDLLAEAKQQAAGGGTPVWLGDGERVLGLLILKDPVRTDSAAAIGNLRSMGISVVMCTGDNQATAEAVARELGIDTVHSELLPEEKLVVVRTLQEQGGKVGMVGDGVNDAPALAKADTGFALGSGTDVAIENADITLSGDSLLLVAHAIAISGATIRNVRQNLFGAFIYNVTGIPLAAGLLYPFTGWLLDPMFASAAMALSSVTVVTNANRLRFFRFR